MEAYINDIPYQLAFDAHSGTSMVPEKRADQERQDYNETLKADYEQLSKGLADDKKELLNSEFARYRQGLRRRKIAQLQAHSRCLSSMVTGPSNFPTRRNEKANNTEHKRLTELIEYRERALKAIERKLHPERGPILGSNPDAIILLSAKIEKAKAYQELMKSVNKIIRSKPKKEKTVDKIIKLLNLGLSESVIDKLFSPDFCDRIGFPSYELTNNNSNIKRMESRLIDLQRKKETPPSSTEYDGFTVEECPDDDRIRIIFEGKPSAETRQILKSNGFRWSSKNTAWQRHLNDAGRWAVERVTRALGVTGYISEENDYGKTDKS
jgi:hypothetical protein